jgi:hypothetical protein
MLTHASPLNSFPRATSSASFAVFRVRAVFLFNKALALQKENGYL